VDGKCQLCKQLEETVDHLTSGCPILAKNKYLMRHDKVGAIKELQKTAVLGTAHILQKVLM
jgi:hypothetical protein